MRVHNWCLIFARSFNVLDHCGPEQTQKPVGASLHRVKRAAGKSHSNNTQWEGLKLHPSTSLCISVKEAAVGAIKC